MSFATITSKGQVTLPKDVRDRLNLKAGDRLSIEVMPDGTFTARPAPRSVMDIIGILVRPGQKPLTVEEMNEAIGKAVVERYNRSKT